MISEPRFAITAPERAERGVPIASPRFPDGVTRVIDDDLLRRDENAHRGFESFDVEVAVGSLELHQVERGEIAGGIVEEKVHDRMDS